MASSHSPHFQHAERAPYEIGHLLLKLPADFSSYSTQPADLHDIADALELHVYNAKEAIMSGLEALGAVMSTAATNPNCSVENKTVSHLGWLVKHLSVELQFLNEVDDTCQLLAQRRASTASKKGGK